MVTKDTNMLAYNAKIFNGFICSALRFLLIKNTVKIVGGYLSSGVLKEWWEIIIIFLKIK